MPKAARRPFHDDAAAYRDPCPKLVARIMDDPLHGPDAARERWFWLSLKSLDMRAVQGRAMNGERARHPEKARRSTAIQEAAGIELSFVIECVRAAEVASGVPGNSLRSIATRRGILELPRAPMEIRVAHTRDGNVARQDTLEGGAARARIEARRDYHVDLYGVLLTALGHAPQPAWGRYVLPPLDSVLIEALDGYPEPAILRIYPGYPFPGGINARTRRLPHDGVIAANWARASTVRALAEDYGVSPAAVAKKAMKLGLPRRPYPARQQLSLFEDAA